MRSVKSAERGDRLQVGGDALEFLLTGEQTSGAVIAFEVEIPAGGGPPMLHRHPSLELYRVQEGRLAVYVERQRTIGRHEAGAGDVVYIPGGAEHTVRNESSLPARAFVVLTPGDELERFARAVAELESPEAADVIASAEANGIEITRPFPEPGGPVAESDRPRSAASHG